MGSFQIFKQGKPLTLKISTVKKKNQIHRHLSQWIFIGIDPTTANYFRDQKQDVRARLSHAHTQGGSTHFNGKLDGCKQSRGKNNLA